MACPYAKTEDGIESQFATNHIGHFLLTKLLMDKILAAGAGSRIVNVSSSVALRGAIRYDDYNFQVRLPHSRDVWMRRLLVVQDGATYDPWLGYSQAKISNIVFSRALARKLKSRGIFSYSLHPGCKYNRHRCAFGSRLTTDPSDNKRSAGSHERSPRRSRWSHRQSEGSS